jgi:predicted Zn-dependent protease
MRYAVLLVAADQPEQAVKLLAEGRLLTEDEGEERQLRQALVDSMVVLSTKIQREDNSPRGLLRRLNLLKEATKIDPSNSNLLEAISNICIQTAASEDEELRIIRESLVRGVDPETAHFILGTVALNQGDLESAMQHLEITLKTNPNLPGLLNNLACAILKQDNADLERALRLSEAAVRAMPEHTYLRETRGQILCQMGRYTEAIPDLEYALASKELRPKIRESLALAYDALGEQDIAARQRELLDQGQ